MSGQNLLQSPHKALELEWLGDRRTEAVFPSFGVHTPAHPISNLARVHEKRIYSRRRRKRRKITRHNRHCAGGLPSVYKAIVRKIVDIRNMYLFGSPPRIEMSSSIRVRILVINTS